ncbi:MAG: NAD(P)-binding domain-containing protein [Acidimicrobiales bacterium]
MADQIALTAFGIADPDTGDLVAPPPMRRPEDVTPHRRPSDDVLAQPIGIIGGTGPAGQGLAARLAANGQAVFIGSRKTKRARRVADEVKAELGDDRSERVFAGTNRQAAAADFVVLATNADHTVEAAGVLASVLAGKIVVSMAASVAPSGRGMRPVLPSCGSIAESVADVLVGSRVVAALQHAPAKALDDIERPFPGDVLVCGDDDEAVSDTISRLGVIEGQRSTTPGASPTPWRSNR